MVLDRFRLPLEVMVRPARREDLLQLESWPGFDTSAHRQALRYYFAQQRRKAGMLLVAEAGGYPIGQLYLWYRREDPQLGNGRLTVSITALRVRRPFRRRGVATRLARAAEKFASKAGFKTATIGADVDNEAALRLYKSWGYREFKRSTYIWDGRVYPQICLRKDLAPADAVAEYEPGDRPDDQCRPPGEGRSGKEESL